MIPISDVQAIIQAELSTSIYSDSAGGIGQLEDSLSTYLGEPDGTEIAGRSQVVSTDCADAIEWVLPQVMKSFTQNNEIVEFDPVHQGDEKQALLESQYVYEVLMKQNDGFIILHQFVKDALMQRNGIIKVYYLNEDCTKVKNYTGLSEEQLQQLLAAEGVEILKSEGIVDVARTKEKQQAMQAQAQQFLEQNAPTPEIIQQFQAEMNKPVVNYNVSVSISRRKGKIVVDSVAPECFRVNSDHNSLCLDNARFTAHVIDMPMSDVIKTYGLSLSEAEELPQGVTSYDREYRFEMSDSSVFFDTGDSVDPSQRLITIYECYMQIDLDGSGISKLMKIVAAGDSTEIIKVEEVDRMPWVSTTAFLMSHKWQGLSFVDRLRQIQAQKTALIRNVLDNIYLQNNQRTKVLEGQVNMDDLLVSRPGGVIRVKNMMAMESVITPAVGDAAMNMMTYLDRVRAGRVGVDPDGNASPDNVGDRVGSQGIERMMNAKEELVGLIIRVIAETGIKPLCIKIRDLAVDHIDAIVDFRFRGEWQKINPAEWQDRTSCTVRVGTGSGNHNEQITALNQIIALQAQITQIPGQTLSTPETQYAVLDDFCRFSGLNGASKYFVDPSSEVGKQSAQQNQQLQAEERAKQDAANLELLHVQVKFANAELSKAETARSNVELKGMVEQQKAQLATQKQQSENVIASLKQQLEDAKLLIDQQGRTADIDLRKYEADQRTALELTRIEVDSQTQQDDNMQQNKGSVQ